MLHIHFVLILPRAQSFVSNMHRTNCLDFNNFQGSLLLASSSVITFAAMQGDYLCRLHQTPRYFRDLLLCVHQQTHKSHTVYVNKVQNIRGLSLHQQSPPFWMVVDKRDNHQSEDREVNCKSNKSELELLDVMMKYTPPGCMQDQLMYNRIPCNSFESVENFQSHKVMIRTDDG